MIFKIYWKTKQIDLIKKSKNIKMLQTKNAYINKIEVKFYFLDNWCGEFYIKTDDSNIASIWNLQIFNSYRGIGLGNQMVKEALEYIDEHLKSELVYLWVMEDNVIAKKIYQKNGFYFSNSVGITGILRMERRRVKYA